MEIILFSYIFTSSIFQIYEKNNVISNKMSCYALTDIDADKLADFYDSIIENIEGHKFEQAVNTVSETNNTEYDLYCLPFDDFSKRQPITSSIHFNYKELTKDDFIDSTGIFYTDISFETLKGLAEKNDLNVRPTVQDKISYSKFLELYAIDFIVLFIVLQIVYGIYTSYNFKKIGIKKSMGFSKKRILKEQIGRVVIYHLVIELVFIIAMSVYYAFTKTLSLVFLILISAYYIGVNLLNIICIFNTSILINLVTIEAMVKNKSINKAMNIAAQITKIVFIVLISICVSRVFTQAKIYQSQQQNILNYKMLNNYYTANGFFSDKYDDVYSNEPNLQIYSSNMKSMYTENQSLLCDCSSFDLIKIEGIGDKISEYELNTVFSNKEYVDQFGTIRINGEKITVKNDTYTVFVAEKYKDKQDEINECISAELYNMKNYNRNYGLSNHNDHDIKYDIIYVDDDSTIICNTSNGFEEKNIGLLYIDNGESDGMLYLDWLNGGYIFYKLNSRDEFKSLLVKYNLDDLVSPGTLLTPYYNKLETVEFTLKTLSVFSIIFIASLLFIIYIAGYVDIIANKSIYSSKEIHGFCHYRILKRKYLIILAECCVILLLGVFDSITLWSLIIIPLDILLHEILYQMFVKSKMYENVKGA